MIIVPVAKPICPALHCDQNNSALKLRILDPCKQTLSSELTGLDREELSSMCTEKVATKMGSDQFQDFLSSLSSTHPRQWYHVYWECPNQWHTAWTFPTKKMYIKLQKDRNILVLRARWKYLIFSGRIMTGRGNWAEERHCHGGTDIHQIHSRPVHLPWSALCNIL